MAHHAGEQPLATLLLLGSGSLSVVVAIGRAHLTAARAKLARMATRSSRRCANGRWWSCTSDEVGPAVRVLDEMSPF